MRITITVNSTLDIEAAIAVLRVFIKDKKPGDGTSDTWGMTLSNQFFTVGVKPNGNYTVKQHD